jgi:hypothetical protein
VCSATWTDILAIKNVHVRLIIFLMQDPLLALLASSSQMPVTLLLEEGGQGGWAVCRSWLQRVFPSWGRLRASRDSMASRNQTLALRLSHMDTMIEIICTVMGVRAPSVPHVPLTWPKL